MSIGFVIGALLVLLAAAGFGFAGLHLSKKRKNKKRAVAGAAVGGVFLLLLLLIPASFHTVQSGEIAVVKHLGEARTVRTAGTYFDFWLTESYDIYDAKVQNLEIATQAYSKDAQTMGVAMTIQYKIDESKALEIANQYGSIAILANRIQSIATEKTKATLSSYSAMQIIETRSSISPTVEAAIKNAVHEGYCVDIVTVVLTNIDFSDAFEKTVEDKMIAEQEKLKAQYEKETAIVNAEKALEVAKLDAQAKVEKAKAEAQSELEVAKAEAEAIRLRSIEVARALGFTIAETENTDDDGVVTVVYNIDFTGKSAEEIALITEYLQYADYLEKWDGKLPSVVTGDSATVMIPTVGTEGTNP